MLWDCAGEREMLKKCAIAVLSVAALCINSGAAVAAQGSGVFGLSLTLTPACSIGSGSTNFAVLDFGQVKASWQAALSASTQAMLSLTCSDGVTSVDVSIDGGLRGNRTLAPAVCGGTCPTIPYRVFRDTARTVEYEIGVAQLFSVPTTTEGQAVQLAIPLYGAIPPGTAGAWGAYSDTLTVTIDFN